MIAVHSYHENNKNVNDKYPETNVEKELTKTIKEMIGNENMENNIKNMTQLEKIYHKKKIINNIKEVSKQIALFSLHVSGIFLIRYFSNKISK